MLPAHTWSKVVVVFGFLMAVSARAQTPQQFRADIEMSGGSMTEPASGILYRGASGLRMELLYEGQTFVILSNPDLDGQYMLMPDVETYMAVGAGLLPVSVPNTQALDPTDPCGTGTVTNCVSLGEETISGYPTAVWQYDDGGETWTSWMAAALGFPLKLVSADGTTIEYSNVETGTQVAALFEIPDTYSEMAGFGGFGGFQPGAGAPPGFDLSSLAALGVDVSNLDPAALAAISGAGASAGLDFDQPSEWDGIEGWVVTLTITTSGERSSSSAGTEPGTIAFNQHDTYSGEYHASIPLNYGTPGVPGAVGPRWQLIAGLGSERMEALPITFSARTEFHSDYAGFLPECGADPSATSVTATRGSADWTGSVATDGGTAALGYLQMSADLQTYELTVGTGRDVTETSETVSNTAACEGEPASTDTSTSSTGQRYDANIPQITGLPLPAAPTTITGSRTMPMNFHIGDFSGDLDATVEWTITPVGQ